jgi:hypothetical protein
MLLVLIVKPQQRGASGPLGAVAPLEKNASSSKRLTAQDVVLPVYSAGVRPCIGVDCYKPRAFFCLKVIRGFPEGLARSFGITNCMLRVLENLTVPQPVKNFSIFYANQRFITVFTRARYLSLS